ncbi:MAG: hypothetical protein HYX51_03130, partial [Chloroflexi bacterium]|nr:hypothetical protein [Chloroflexota bacterium]
MNDPLDRLRRVLVLERSRGFPNTTVIGGVDRMLHTLLKDGLLEPGTAAHDALASLPGHGYASMSIDDRERWAERILRQPSSPPATQRAAREREMPPPVPLTLPRVSILKPAAITRPIAEVRRPPVAAFTSHPVIATPRPAAKPRKAAKPHADGIEAPVTALPGVSVVTAKKLAKLDLYTIRDLLWHLPHRYDDFSRIRTVSELVPGQEQTAVGTVWSAAETQMGRFKRGTEAVIGDHTGNLRVVWFNQPWVAKQLPTTARVALSGKVSVFQGVRQMESPEWELLEGDLSDAVHTGRLLPVYQLTAGLSARTLRRLVRLALDTYLDTIDEPLPWESRDRHGLLSLRDALAKVHYPDDAGSARTARDRLAFDELLTLQFAVLRRRAERTLAASAPAIAANKSLTRAFHESLPFPLTGAQEKVSAQILS